MTGGNPAIRRAEELAIIRQVWSLDKTLRDQLTHAYIAGTNLGDFLHHLDDSSHNYRDYIRVGGYTYEVSYMDCGLQMMEDLPEDSAVLISFRYCARRNIAVALVRLADPRLIGNFAAYKYLAPDYQSSSLPKEGVQIDG